MTGAAFYSAVEAVPFIITGPVGSGRARRRLTVANN